MKDTMPASWSQAKATGTPLYFTGKPCKRGHVAPRRTGGGNCVECQAAHHTTNRDSISARAKERYASNRDAVIARTREYRTINREAVRDRNRAYHEANREAIAAKRKANREAIAAWERTYRQTPEGRAGKRAKDARYRAAKLQSVPHLTPEDHARIKAIYAACPDGWHVDHVKPLALAGSHHPGNLRALPASVNVRKGASWSPTDPRDLGTVVDALAEVLHPSLINIFRRKLAGLVSINTLRLERGEPAL